MSENPVLVAMRAAAGVVCPDAPVAVTNTGLIAVGKGYEYLGGCHEIGACPAPQIVDALRTEIRRRMTGLWEEADGAIALAVWCGDCHIRLRCDQCGVPSSFRRQCRCRSGSATNRGWIAPLHQ